MFITNRHNTNENPAEPASMSGRLKEIIPVTETLSVLSGYFYFNGIPPLVNPIAANRNLKLRILVGLDVDRKGYELAHLGDGETAQEQFRNSLRNYARSAMFDSDRCALSVEMFLTMMEEGRLVIRKTKEPNHAKLYIFEMTEAVAAATDPIRWITGSSNLTYPGLVSQNEFNVELSNFGGPEAKEYFDNLWEDAEEITEFPGMTREIRKILKDEGVHAEVTPYEAYALVLKNYLEHRSVIDKTKTVENAFKIPKDPFTREPKYKPFSFQVDAVNQALSIVQTYGGVIVADVVGLGKSVIGSVLGHMLGEGRGLVIAPPGLVGDRVEGTGWWGYLQDFLLDSHGWEAWSRGRLDDVAAYVAKHPDFDTVIVDEAHYFRNEDSIEYDYLWRICQGRRVVLMTATPYSNRPSDMYSLLKLFSVPKQSRLVPNGDLEAAFAELQRGYMDCDYVLKNVKGPRDEKEEERTAREQRVRTRLARLEINAPEGIPFDVPAIEAKVKDVLGDVAAEIRMIMEPVMIRRNRIDLRNDPQYRGEVGENLPTVHPPEEQFYQLSPEQSAFYDRVIKTYFGKDSTFKGAIYRPGRYAKTAPQGADDGEDAESAREAVNLQQENMYKFIRRLLVHRFESSFGAFEKTVKNILKFHYKVRTLSLPKELGGNGIIVLDRVMMEKFYLKGGTLTDEMFEQMLSDYEEVVESESEKKQVYRIATDFTQEGYARFLADLDADRALFQKVSDEISELDLVADDPKAKQLCTMIERVLAGRAGFAGRDGEPKRKVLVFSEFADTVDHVAKYLRTAFPNRVSVVRSLNRVTAEEVRRNFDGTIPASARQDQFDVMIATDKMSEGFNLNRAGLVINYDIPWNPTRVIQRIGRINRIGTKVFGDLYLYNYFPTDQGNDLYNIRTVAKTKVLMIHKAIGEDAQIFSTEEAPEASGLFEKLSANPEDSESMTFLTECKIAYAEIRAQHPEVIEKISHLPNRVKTATDGARAGTYLFTRKGLTLFSSFMGAEEGKPSYMLMKEALRFVKCPFGQPRRDGFSAGFWNRYKALTADAPAVVGLNAHATQSLEARTVPVLMGAIQGGVEAEFARALLRNLQQCASLPDRVLREIVSANKRGALAEYLHALRESVGEHLSGRAADSGEDAVIVAIDHTRDD